MTEYDALDIAVRAVSNYAQQHPRPPHVTMTPAAEMLNLSRPTVRKLMLAGKIKDNRCGLISVDQIDALLNSDY